MPYTYSSARKESGPRALVMIALAFVHLVVAWCLITSDKAALNPPEPATSYVQLTIPVLKKEAPADVLSPRVREKERGTAALAGPTARQARPVPVAQSDGDIGAAEESPNSPAKNFDIGMALSEARRIAAEPPTGIDSQRERFRAEGGHGTPLEKAIGRAHRADCRIAHSGEAKANVFALIPIVNGALSDKGCKW